MVTARQCVRGCAAPTQITLCGACVALLGEVVELAGVLIQHLRHVEDVARDSNYRKAGAGTPLTTSWLAADEIERALKRWRTVTKLEPAHFLAGDALTELEHLTASARKRWPLPDDPMPSRRIESLRCPYCSQRGLRLWPVECFGDPLRVVCDECRNTLSHDEFDRLVALVAAQANAPLTRRRVFD